jgi:hypothetical protein
MYGGNIHTSTRPKTTTAHQATQRIFSPFLSCCLIVIIMIRNKTWCQQGLTMFMGQATIFSASGTWPWQSFTHSSWVLNAQFTEQLILSNGGQVLGNNEGLFHWNGWNRDEWCTCGEPLALIIFIGESHLVLGHSAVHCQPDSKERAVWETLFAMSGGVLHLCVGWHSSNERLLVGCGWGVLRISPSR